MAVLLGALILVATSACSHGTAGVVGGVIPAKAVTGGQQGSSVFEVTSAGRPESVRSVPSQIPPEGVFVDHEFELLPLSQRKTALDSELTPASASEAITAAQSNMTVSHVKSVTALKAIYVSRYFNMPAWIIDYKVRPTTAVAEELPGVTVPPNVWKASHSWTVSNVVVALNTYEGFFVATDTP